MKILKNMRKKTGKEGWGYIKSNNMEIWVNFMNK